MSKLYDKYKYLKFQNPSTFYLFKSGIFYIFLDEDAKTMSSILNLKLTNLNENVLKCGFPVNNLAKYLNLIKNTDFKVEILDSSSSPSYSSESYISNSNILNFLLELSKIDSESLSIKEAYLLIDKIHSQAKTFIERQI